MREKAVILFSGGLDSTTSLYWAKRQFSDILPLSFIYGQKHSIEIKMGKKILSMLNIKQYVLRLPLKNFIRSALIDSDLEIPVSLTKPKPTHAVPATYVPFRNGIFLSLAAAFAESRKIFHLVTGFNVIDSPDYPDTTPEFADKMLEAINQGTSAILSGKRFHLHTPLINKTKKDIIQLGLTLGANYAYAISCYRGDEIPCFQCPSCELRCSAFNTLNIEDPLVTRLKKEGKL